MYKHDVKIAKSHLADLPTHWDGKRSVLELKDKEYNWRQMEWWAFYFEFLCQERLAREFEIPGDDYKHGKTRTSCFDLKRSINWDLKAKAIKSDDNRSILNDKSGMDWSIDEYGFHGLIIGLCDVEYNDNDRSFQRWHDELKGGKSKYEKEREQRTSVSRYRKTRADLVEILFLVVHSGNVSLLGIHQQGRNSNGKPRPPKYMLDYDEETLSEFLVDRIGFSADSAG